MQPRILIISIWTKPTPNDSTELGTLLLSGKITLQSNFEGASDPITCLLLERTLSNWHLEILKNLWNVMEI